MFADIDLEFEYLVISHSGVMGAHEILGPIAPERERAPISFGMLAGLMQAFRNTRMRTE